jgi:hypothetical protein
MTFRVAGFADIGPTPQLGCGSRARKSAGGAGAALLTGIGATPGAASL